MGATQIQVLNHLMWSTWDLIDTFMHQKTKKTVDFSSFQDVLKILTLKRNLINFKRPQKYNGFNFSTYPQLSIVPLDTTWLNIQTSSKQIRSLPGHHEVMHILISPGGITALLHHRTAPAVIGHGDFPQRNTADRRRAQFGRMKKSWDDKAKHTKIIWFHWTFFFFSSQTARLSHLLQGERHTLSWLWT